MISTSVVMLARLCYISLNLSSLFRPLTRRQLWVTFIFHSLSEHKGLDWLQSKYELRQSCSPTFPLTVSVTPSHHFQCLYLCFEFGEKASRGKKGSKTTAQGVYRLLDDLRSCYEAVCGFSLGARLWVQPAACCGEAAKPKFTFVCACVRADADELSPERSYRLQVWAARCPTQVFRIGEKCDLSKRV